jgi:hypothetical protein
MPNCGVYRSAAIPSSRIEPEPSHESILVCDLLLLAFVSDSYSAGIHFKGQSAGRIGFAESRQRLSAAVP